ncbi:hypothetical protein BJ741DRAFT_164769 [Chytriomyces cf. hyalinus JEL632]|nr:hypothetical protein BJ741DRAFT_164769 [Chytriomyces cf. hyalinus JEL632]
MIERQCPPNCPCCERHEVTIQSLQRTVQSLQQHMLDEVNSLRRLLQMPLLTRVDSSFLPQKTTACLFIDATPSIPAIPVIPTLESMPPEILDQIASFVSGYDIVHLSHAVRYYKYISKAIFDFGQPLRTRTLNRLVKLFTWPSVFLRGPTAGMPYESTLPVPISHLHVLQTYSKVLNKHDGYAIIDDSVGTEAFLGALPEVIEVHASNVKSLAVTGQFFGALHNCKKFIRTLHLGYIYFQHCKSDPGSLEMTAKWLVKLRIQELRFQDRGSVPMQIRDILHSMPMLSSLHVQNVEHLAGIALSECKLLRKLTLSKLFHGEESPLELVQQLLNIVNTTKIQKVVVLLPEDWLTFLPSTLHEITNPLFEKHGWYQHPVHLVKDAVGQCFAGWRRG